MTLDSASALAHDGLFRLSDIAFDEQSQFFRLVFYLPDNEKARYHRILWPVSRRDIPYASWELTFSSVQSCHVQIENDTNASSLIYEIASVRLDPDGTKIRIATHYVVTIDLVVPVLSGEVHRLSDISPMPPSSSLVIRAFRD